MEVPRVLVVDDDPDLAVICSLVLESEGYDTNIARNGVEAYDLLKADNIDLVLLDVMMPVMDGLTVCKMMKRNPAMRDLPVIIMSASDTMRAQAVSCHANAIIDKPFDIDLQIDTVGRLTYHMG